jgi:hypothetical protein
MKKKMKKRKLDRKPAQIAWALAGWFVLAAFLQGLARPVLLGAQEAGGPVPGQTANDGRQIPLFGKITAVHDSSMEVLNSNGETVVVKVNDKTEFRKDRQTAKRSDFKVGDVVLVRGEENPDHSWTAQIVGGRSANGSGPSGRGGPGGGGPFVQGGTLGKDFVIGEIKSVDAPKLAVLRADNVTQTLELNEETSLRKGRESITMADVQVGDHVFARGVVQNDVFVPKMVVVINPEQWKRMQEMREEMGDQRRAPPAPDGAGAQSQKPPESQR